MFKKILVPVDGSETSWRALNNALEIGRKFNSEIVVVNVIQPYNNAALLAVPLDHSTISRGNSELERIIALAKKVQADAIVIGSRGLSGIAEFFLGSVSSKVSQYAAVPVLIVK